MKQRGTTTNIKGMTENKNKNKSWMIKILALAIIIFFNGMLFGGVVMAADYDQKCYDEYMQNNLCMNTVPECKQKAETTYQQDLSECTMDKSERIKTACSQFNSGTDEYKNCINETNLPFDIQSEIDPINADYNKCTQAALDKKNKASAACDVDEPKKITECQTKLKQDAEQACVYICGDGVKQGPEECDDGNAVDGDGCSSECKISAVCGNGVPEPGEECDDGEGQGDDVDKYLDPTKPDKEKQFDSCLKCKYVDVPYEFNVTKYLKIPEGQTYLEKSTNPDTSVSLKKGVIYFIVTGIEFATKIISAFALLFIIVGGIVLMVSSGNSSLQQKGKRLILYSILGLVIAFMSLIIVTSVQSIFYTI